MTRAVCIQCGASKHGALTLCTTCSFQPATPEEQAKAIILSDHHMSASALTEAGEQLASGKQFHMDPELVAAYANEIRENPGLTSAPGCRLAIYVLVGAVLVLLILTLAYVF